MTAAALRLNGSPPEIISAIEIFQLRAWARAVLHEAAVFTLHEAVDPLWAAAERTGLIDELGPDFIQRIIARGFHEACR
jgi:hypothetical protein